MATSIKQRNKSMSNVNAAENSNKEQIYRTLETSKEIPLFRIKRSPKSVNDVRAETKENPNDPKFSMMAEEIAYQHMHLKRGDVKSIAVSEVTTQISEIKFRKQFLVELKENKIINCSSEVLEKFEENVKLVSYKCHEIEDMTFLYIPIANKSAVEYIQKLPEGNTITSVKFDPIPIVTLPVSQKQILYINIDVHCKDYGGMDSVQKCTVLFDIPDDTVPLSVHCFEDPIENYKGADVWVNPTEFKYISLAEKALLNNTKVIKDAKEYDIIVTFVVHKISWGRNKIDFIVRVLKGDEYKCRATVWETASEGHVEDVKCELRQAQAKKLLHHGKHRGKK